jgi:hypothetical protein
MFPDGNREEEPLTSDNDPRPDTLPRDEASLGGGATENAEANIGNANLPSIDSSSRDREEPAVTPPHSIATSTSGASSEIDVPEAPADPIFDPHEFIPPTSGAENEHWEELIASGAVHVEYTSPWLRELAERARSSFGLPSLDAFTGFQAGGFTPKTGEYSFQINSSEFVRLLKLAKCTFVADSGRRGLIKMSVSQCSLRAQAYDHALFSETVLPLKDYATGVTKEQPISFVVPFDDFETACKAIDGTATFTYRPEQARIEIVAGNFERPVVTRSVEGFHDFDEATIGTLDQGSRRTIDPQLIGSAIAYVAPVAVENQTEEHFNLIEFREGRLLGGSRSAIAIFTAAGLNGLGMRIRYRFIDPVRTVLTLLDSEAALFETARFYIIRDCNTAFGFEKPSRSFPDITYLLSPRSGRDRFLLASRKSGVVHGLAALEACAASVAFQCSKGRGVDARLSFMGQSEDGKKIKVSLYGARHDYSNEKSVVVFFPPRPLRTAAAAFDTPNLCMDLYTANNCLIVTDHEYEEEGERGYHAQTLISTLPKPNRVRPRTSILKGTTQ